MKKVYSSILLVFCFVSIVLTTEAQTKSITLYSGDFDGIHEDFAVGRYDDRYLMQSGFSTIRSIRVPAGLKVTLYSEGNYNGESLVITENAHTSYLEAKGFGKIGLRVSMVVEEYTIQENKTPAVTIYKDNFSGASKTLLPGYYNVFNLGDVGNDQLSSVKIPKGMKVILYEHSDFGGISLTLTEDASASLLLSKKFNDFTSSIKVEDAPEPKPTPTQPPVVVVIVNPEPEKKAEPTTPPVVTPPAEPMVTIYQGDFNGTSKSYKKGGYWLESMGFANDELSSVKIPTGFRVTLYEDDMQNGRSIVLIKDTPTAFLVDNNFNNKTSSIYIEELPKATIYQGDFSGLSKNLGPGWYNRDSLGIGGDELSSIKVPQGLRVTLYEHNNFKGFTVELTSDANNAFLKRYNFDNLTSSIVVEQIENVLPTVTIYTDDFSGNSQSLLPGKYDYPFIEIGNNTLSSLRIPRGFKVKLYEFGAFEGRWIELKSDARVDYLSSKNFNDVTSSIEIEKIPDSELWVTVYQDGYSGASQAFTPGSYDSDRLSFENQISSVHVPKGMRVILYEEPGFRGKSVTFEANADFTGIPQINDRASSLIVEDLVAQIPATPTTIPQTEPIKKTVVVVPFVKPTQPTTIAPPPCVMSEKEQYNAISQIRLKSFASEKLETAKQVTADKCLTLAQIKGIMNAFDFEEERLEFIKYAYELSIEKADYFSLSNSLSFLTSKENFSEFLRSAPKPEVVQPKPALTSSEIAVLQTEATQFALTVVNNYFAQDCNTHLSNFASEILVFDQQGIIIMNADNQEAMCSNLSGIILDKSKTFQDYLKHYNVKLLRRTEMEALSRKKAIEFYQMTDQDFFFIGTELKDKTSTNFISSDMFQFLVRKVDGTWKIVGM